ncbi:MAG: SH3 domain-containing protein [Proteobacteria bacterium]|nr:SH3 domain-containing protein [Pseudomonadota bacterium]
MLLAILLLAAPALAGERLSVSVSRANVRSGPGTGYPVLWQVERYYPMEVVSRSGDWVRFSDFEKDQGWLHKDLLGKTRSVVCKGDDVNVRTGPGAGDAVAFRVQRGVPLKVVSEKGDWLEVLHADGDRGWVHKSLVW